MDDKIAMVVTMRTGSSRMPGKMTAPIANGKCSVDFFHDLFCELKGIVSPVIAVPEDEIQMNTELVKKIKSRKIKIYGGSEDDVFSRVMNAAGRKEYIIDVTGDCPFISSYLIKEFVSRYSEFMNLNYSFYASNVFPTRVVPDGQDIQLYKKSLMKEIIKTDYIKEHSGYSVYRWCMKNVETEERERIFKLTPRASLIPGSENIRMTLDTKQDSETLCRLYRFYDLFDNLKTKEGYEGFIEYVMDFEKTWWPNRYITPKKIQE